MDRAPGAALQAMLELPQCAFGLGDVGAGQGVLPQHVVKQHQGAGPQGEQMFEAGQGFEPVKAQVDAVLADHPRMAQTKQGRGRDVEVDRVDPAKSGEEAVVHHPAGAGTY